MTDRFSDIASAAAMASLNISQPRLRQSQQPPHQPQLSSPPAAVQPPVQVQPSRPPEEPLTAPQPTRAPVARPRSRRLACGHQRWGSGSGEGTTEDSRGNGIPAMESDSVDVCIRQDVSRCIYKGMIPLWSIYIARAKSRDASRRPPRQPIPSS